MKPTYPYWLLMALYCAMVAMSCKKVGKERYQPGQYVDIKKGEQRRGLAPYHITGFYRHAIEQDDAITMFFLARLL